VIGTVPSFETGLLWPAFMAAFGDVFGVVTTALWLLRRLARAARRR
jgi:hypothetical protein